VLESYISAFGINLQPLNILALCLGIIIGLVLGIIPTISSLFLIPLIMPFVYDLPVEFTLILFASIVAVVYTSCAITAILLNIPGSNTGAATILDGYPLTRKGQAGRAIGAAVMSSMAAGIVPVFLSLAIIPLLLPVILAFGQPEMAALVLVGLAFLASLSGKSVKKGIISGTVGLLISLIGYHSITGVQRFSFNTNYLYDGLSLIPMILGLFGLTEIFVLITVGLRRIAEKDTKNDFKMIFSGVKDVWRHRWLWFRSVIIGHGVGIIPGIGAEAGSWICYGHARQTSRNPEEFGTGRIEGVIAPEAANNAGESGGLLTTMILGIPGSAVMTFFLATFLIKGVVPGPAMMSTNLPLVIALQITIAVANIAGGLICLFAANKLAKIATVDVDFLIPGVLILALAGAYLATNSILCFAVILVFLVVGYFMKKYGYPRPALILGFVLGGLFENYTLLSIKIYGISLFARPLVIALLVLVVLVLAYPGIHRKITNRKQVKIEKQ